MEYSGHIKERVEKYCGIVGIDTKRPLNLEQRRHIEIFIKHQVKVDKSRAKAREEEKKMRIEIPPFLTQSPIEDILYREMIKHGLDIYFIPQVEVGVYALDFGCHEYMLGIECDGHEYHSSKDHIKRDKKRDKYLRNKGWTILRIEGIAIFRNPEYCVNQIKKIIEQKMKARQRCGK